jgi:hypothetical protein
MRNEQGIGVNVYKNGSVNMDERACIQVSKKEKEALPEDQ